MQVRTAAGAVGGTTAAGTSVVLAARADGRYDLRLPSGTVARGVPAADVESPAAAVEGGGGCSMHTLLSRAVWDPDAAHEREPAHVAFELALRRDRFVDALLPALLAAHARKSSVHQRFLGALVLAPPLAIRTSRSCSWGPRNIYGCTLDYSGK